MLGIIDDLGKIGGAFGSALAGGLGAVGDIFSAPRRGLFSLLENVGISDPSESLKSSDNPLLNALGYGVEMATDPLTYLGGSIGRLAGRAAGKPLEAAALARGPRYGGGMSKLDDAISDAMAWGDTDSLKTFNKLKLDPAFDRILEEIPEGSTFLGGGTQALPFKTPAGDVLRIQPGMLATPPGRLQVPEMLQPTRNVTAGMTRMERVPFASDVGDRELWQRAIPEMRESVAKQGAALADYHPGNFGTYEGRPVFIEPGALRTIRGVDGPSFAPEIRARTPGRIQNWLLDLFDADERIRRSLGDI